MSTAEDYKIRHEKPVLILIKRFENLSSRSLVCDTNFKKSLPVEFVEFGDGTVTLCLPEKVCNVGHSIDVILHTENHEVHLELSSRGKIVNVSPGDDKTIVAKIELHKYDDKLFKKIKNVFVEIQNDVDSLFQAVRGY